MASFNVTIRHQGKKYDVEIDPESSGELFKYQVFSLTGVEPERQKILIKGGQLKNDAEMGKLGLKPGNTIMLMGTPGGTLQRPTEKIKFVEDMTEAEAARQEGATPAGLQNLGNTCYLNSTLQTLRSIPELQETLRTYRNTSTGDTMRVIPQLDLAGQLRDLYKSMSETQTDFPPHLFLSALRTTFPQFAERSRHGQGFAQQDAEEAWSQIVSQLRQRVKIEDTSGAAENDTSGGPGKAVSFVDRYMAGEFVSTLECNEPEARAGGEEPTTSRESFLKLSCHIDGTTNHLRDGILAALSEEVEKRSTVLERDAKYTKRSRISRLPKYLTVHFVRFFWKREVQKKAKIMRKVTFPHELDVVEFCTDDLKKALVPVRDKVREIRKDEEDIERARKRRRLNPLLDGLPEEPSASRKKQPDNSANAAAAAAARAGAAAPSAPANGGGGGGGDVEMTETYKTDAEVEAEKDAALLAAKRELHSLINPGLSRDEGSNQSGLYELRGVVTHQGASADSGHYTAYVKKTAPWADPRKKDAANGGVGASAISEGEDGKWWWFNDDKVSEVTSDKIDALAGGGESHSALILLYRAIPLPSADGTVE